MNPFSTIGRGVCNLLVNIAPDAFLDSLRKNHYELVAREFNKAYLFDWKQARLPERLDGFEDLASLFGLSPMSRGIIRQDFDEAAALFKAVRSLPQARGVEIGRFSGGSTLLLAAAVGERGRLISIDIGPQNDRALVEVLEKSNVRSRVDLLIGDANKVDCKEELDFAFIDGDHSYEGARRDHNLWGRRVKQCGLIIHHDMSSSRKYATQWSELARLRTDILDRQSNQLKLVEETGSLAIFKKMSDSWSDV